MLPGLYNDQDNATFTQNLGLRINVNLIDYQPRLLSKAFNYWHPLDLLTDHDTIL